MINLSLAKIRLPYIHSQLPALTFNWFRSLHYVLETSSQPLKLVIKKKIGLSLLDEVATQKQKLLHWLTKEKHYDL